MQNSISFKVWGRYALFTDPLTRVGGEKYSYHIPTYEALKGIAKSIYWKPTIVWIIDRVRVMKPIQTQSKGTKPLDWSGGNSLAIYTFLKDVEYQVDAHFEWNEHRPELSADRIDGKHYAIANRMVEKGGRQDIFLGVRDCQGYVEPCEFGAGPGYFDETNELSFGTMFHGFDYPDETGLDKLGKRLFTPVMKAGVVEFPRPEACTIRSHIRDMSAKPFIQGQSLRSVAEEETP